MRYGTFCWLPYKLLTLQRAMETNEAAAAAPAADGAAADADGAAAQRPAGGNGAGASANGAKAKDAAEEPSSCRVDNPGRVVPAQVLALPFLGA